MKRIFAIALGILTAIGGFVDIGDLVTNAQVGARFGLSLAWVVVVGVVGICVFAEMSGRIAAMSGRATFDLVRERLGPRVGLLNLLGSMSITFLTFVAEICGVALSLQLVSSVHELLIIPLVGLLVWLILWRAKFSAIENILGLLGLALVVFAVALWQLGPDWGALTHQAVTVDKPADEQWRTWAYYGVALSRLAQVYSEREDRGWVEAVETKPAKLRWPAREEPVRYARRDNFGARPLS